MSVEPNEIEVEDVKSDFVLTDELRELASKRPVFNILYITDGNSRLRPFRGETALRNFAEFYTKQADITYMTAPSSKLAKMTMEDLKGINILWVDNATDYLAAKKLSEIHPEFLGEIDPNWKETIATLEAEDKDKAFAYVKQLSVKRENKIRIVYALDEFIWEGPVGRSHDIQTMQIMETFMNIADIIVVPTVELKDMIRHLSDQARSKNIRPLVLDVDKPIAVIPTAMNAEFSPVYKNFTRDNKNMTMLTMEKPKVLVKGVSIPANVEEFIMENYRKMEITLSSVDEVNEHILGLMQRGKIKHIYHWANPYVNKSNIFPTYAIERDFGYDFVIHTLPDSLDGNAYEITTGEEDILFSTSYGALSICGIEHLIPDYVSDDDRKEMQASMLGFRAGLTFGKDTPAKKIRAMIESHKIPARWNEAYNKYRPYVEGRLITSPNIIQGYFVIMLGRDLAMAREAIATETRVQIESEANAAKDKQVAAVTTPKVALPADITNSTKE
jgi:hypothetical protein